MQHVASNHGRRSGHAITLIEEIPEHQLAAWSLEAKDVRGVARQRRTLLVDVPHLGKDRAYIGGPIEFLQLSADLVRLEQIVGWQEANEFAIRMSYVVICGDAGSHIPLVAKQANSIIGDGTHDIRRVVRGAVIRNGDLQVLEILI